MKTFGFIVLAIVVLVGAIILLGNSGEDVSNDPTVVSTNGIHVHPTVSVFINGEQQVVPANLGLLGGAASVHTHDTSGTLHYENGGVIRVDDLRLSQFFKAWGKQFSSQCVLDSCNGPEGNVSMTVNSVGNTEFEKYQIKDQDNIEIRYE